MRDEQEVCAVQGRVRSSDYAYGNDDSEKGREINNNALAERKELENRIRKGLSDEEFDTLMRLLRKVAYNMHEE